MRKSVEKRVVMHAMKARGFKVVMTWSKDRPYNIVGLEHIKCGWKSARVAIRKGKIMRGQVVPLSVVRSKPGEFDILALVDPKEAIVKFIPGIPEWLQGAKFQPRAFAKSQPILSFDNEEK